MLSTSPAVSRPSVSPAVLPVICIALATVVSAVASLNVAIPSIARDTHATQTQLTWIIDAYALIFAALLPLGGAIGDRYGRRRALVAGLMIFLGGSVAATTVSDPAWLMAMRGILGVGAALVMPATLSTITNAFAAEQRSRAVGTWAGVAGASAILGLVASGLVLEEWSWRAVFALNIGLAIIAVAGTLAVIPESADPNAPRLDVTGALITSAGLGVLVYAIIEAPTAGWTSVRTVLLGIVGLVSIAGFAVWELGRDHPLLDPRLFTHRDFAGGGVSITLQFFAFFGFIFLFLQYLQLVRGDSPLVAAASLLPIPLAMMPMARGLAPALVRTVGARAVCVLGLTVITAALLVLSRLQSSSSYWLMLIGLVPLGAGMGLAMTPATTAITDSLPADKQGVGSAVNDLARELGGALGIAVLGSVLQSIYRNHLHLGALAAPDAQRARSSLGIASRLGPSVATEARSAFVAGMDVALMCAAVAVAFAAFAVVLLMRPRGSAPSPRS